MRKKRDLTAFLGKKNKKEPTHGLIEKKFLKREKKFKASSVKKDKKNQRLGLVKKSFFDEKKEIYQLSSVTKTKMNRSRLG